MLALAMMRKMAEISFSCTMISSRDNHNNKPVMMINLGGIWQRRRIHIHVAAVMGDQKSQDYLCGRKSINFGNAGWVHHSCMVLAIQASNVSMMNHAGC
jgi:hypothetical protein